jgi:hypothetical protein
VTARRFQRTPGFTRVAILAALSVAASPATPLVEARGAAQSAPAKPAAQPAALSNATVDGWPKAFTTDAGAVLVVYQPQVASWTDQRRLVRFSDFVITQSNFPGT